MFYLIHSLLKITHLQTKQRPHASEVPHACPGRNRTVFQPTGSGWRPWTSIDRQQALPALLQRPQTRKNVMVVSSGSLMI